MTTRLWAGTGPCRPRARSFPLGTAGQGMGRAGKAREPSDPQRSAEAAGPTRPRRGFVIARRHEPGFVSPNTVWCYVWAAIVRHCDASPAGRLPAGLHCDRDPPLVADGDPSRLAEALLETIAQDQESERQTDRAEGDLARILTALLAGLRAERAPPGRHPHHRRRRGHSRQRQRWHGRSSVSERGGEFECQ